MNNIITHNSFNSLVYFSLYYSLDFIGLVVFMGDTKTNTTFIAFLSAPIIIFTQTRFCFWRVCVGDTNFSHLIFFNIEIKLIFSLESVCGRQLVHCRQIFICISLLLQYILSLICGYILIQSLALIRFCVLYNRDVYSLYFIIIHATCLAPLSHQVVCVYVTHRCAIYRQNDHYLIIILYQPHFVILFQSIYFFSWILL